MKFKLLIFLTLFSFGCSSQNQSDVPKGKLFSVCLSPDDSTFLYSYLRNDSWSINTFNRNTKELKLIIKSEKDETLLNPRYSSNGNSILYISVPKNMKNNAIFTVDRSGQNKRLILEQEDLITDAVFSQNSKRILYCAAGEFNNYSPIAPKAPHKMDIYSIDIQSKVEVKLTKIDAYSIQNLVSYGNALFFIKNLDGPYRILNTEPDKIEMLTPNNESEVKTIGCSDYFLKNDTLYFLTGGGYELYGMDMKSRKAALIIHTNYQMKNLGGFNKSNKIMYTRNLPNDNIVVVYDITTHSAEEILIPL